MTVLGGVLVALGHFSDRNLINLCVSLRPWRLCGSDFAVKTGDLVDPQELT